MVISAFTRKNKHKTRAITCEKYTRAFFGVGFDYY